MKNIKPSITLILLGLQGCGKGTQAFELQKKYNFNYIEMGGTLRKIIKTRKGPSEVINYVKNGKLVPAKLINTLIEKEVLKVGNNKSLILDGYPRSLGQAYFLNKLLKETNRDKNYLVVYCKISKKRALERLLNRWICTKCGKIFSGNMLKKCSCGEKLEKRQDEKPQIIKNRFKYVSKNLDKIKKYYAKTGRLVEVDAEKSIKQITQNIVSEVGL